MFNTPSNSVKIEGNSIKLICLLFCQTIGFFFIKFPMKFSRYSESVAKLSSLPTAFLFWPITLSSNLVKAWYWIAIFLISWAILIMSSAFSTGSVITNPSSKVTVPSPGIPSQAAECTCQH